MYCTQRRTHDSNSSTIGINHVGLIKNKKPILYFILEIFFKMRSSDLCSSYKKKHKWMDRAGIHLIKSFSSIGNA